MTRRILERGFGMVGPIRASVRINVREDVLELYDSEIEDLPVDFLVNSNRLWLLRTRVFQLDEGSDIFVGTAPAMARPTNLVDNMWKKTTEGPPVDN